MKLLQKLTAVLIMTGATFSLLSCDDIYADPSELNTGGSQNAFQYVDASDYTQWIYFDLEKGTDTTLLYTDSAHVPARWHMALHRYDVKTNGGGVLETSYASLENLQADVLAGVFQLPAADQFTPDTQDSITTDMSHMMDGYLVKAYSTVNKVASRWIHVDTSSMPPTYTLSGRVYLIRQADGTVAAVLFTGFRHPKKGSGYITFDYIYPLRSAQ